MALKNQFHQKMSTTKKDQCQKLLHWSYSAYIKSFFVMFFHITALTVHLLNVKIIYVLEMTIHIISIMWIVISASQKA